MRRKSAPLDGAATGKPLHEFVPVGSSGWGGTAELSSMTALPEVEEIHCGVSDPCLLLEVRCVSSRALKALLAGRHAMPGVEGTRSDSVLSTCLERPFQAAVTLFVDAGLRTPDGPPPK